MNARFDADLTLPSCYRGELYGVKTDSPSSDFLPLRRFDLWGSSAVSNGLNHKWKRISNGKQSTEQEQACDLVSALHFLLHVHLRTRLHCVVFVSTTAVHRLLRLDLVTSIQCSRSCVNCPLSTCSKSRTAGIWGVTISLHPPVSSMNSLSTRSRDPGVTLNFTRLRPRLGTHSLVPPRLPN